MTLRTCRMEGPPPDMEEGDRNRIALTAEEILGVQDLTIRPVDIPEWGGIVYIRTMTGRERDAFERVISKAGSAVDVKDFRGMFAALVVCDQDGARLFGDEHIEALTSKNGRALDRIFDEGAKLNGIRESDIEELLKNSQSNQNADSGSD